MGFLGTYEINYKMAASDGKCLISTILRAAVCKHDRLGVCKMSKLFIQDISLILIG